MVNQTTRVQTRAHNKNLFTNELNMKMDGEISTYFENEAFVFLSPGTQNERWTFDLAENAVKKMQQQSKESFLVIRFFDEFLVTDFKTVFDELLKSELINEKGKKWSMKVNGRNDEYFTTVYGSAKEVKLEKYDKEGLISFFQVTTNDVQISSDISIIPHLHTYITEKGFCYSLENIANLYYSLRSKPFVILSGVSGTGKTKLVQLFAEAWGATEERKQYKLIPVRPDWSDSSDLIGYTDLKGEFQLGPLAEMIMEASNKPSLPHFVVLDEMNLARVEYYLSEVLSVMESRNRGEDGEVTTAEVFSYEGESYRLPDNLYIIGTVNMDETTHPFSKKVLDRANSIEFNDIQLLDFGMFEEEAVPVAVTVDNRQLKSEYLFLKDAYPQYKDLIVEVSTFLEEINKELQAIYAQVGYRVRDEICFYRIYSEQDGSLTADEAMDFCIMQKILPRISGAGTDIHNLLCNLFEKFACAVDRDADFTKGLIVPANAKYPRSAHKVQEMLARLARQGFTSFWIA